MKTICSPKRRGSMLSLVLLVLPLAASCGGPTKGTVSGKVTYRGKSLPNGVVMFVLENKAPLRSNIQSDGSYRIDNVPVGQVKISVRPKAALTAFYSFDRPRNPRDYEKIKAAMTKSWTPIPPKYSDPNKSGLTYPVTEGPQQFDIILK